MAQVLPVRRQNIGSRELTGIKANNSLPKARRLFPEKQFNTHHKAEDYLLLFCKWSFALQNNLFYLPKQLVLPTKTTCFTHQNNLFYNVSNDCLISK
jgi:hypothetical protein